MASGGLEVASEVAVVYLIRPVLAIAFIFTLILFSWYVAWRTVLMHVPLVQEIAGLRPKKPSKPKPANRGRIAMFYQKSRTRPRPPKGTSNQKGYLKRKPPALCNKYQLHTVTIVCKFLAIPLMVLVFLERTYISI